MSKDVIEAILEDIVSLLRSVTETIQQPASAMRTKRLLDIRDQLEGRIGKLKEEADREEQSG